mgnify:CR=1 FL=1
MFFSRFLFALGILIMAVEIIMPKLGVDMQEGEIIEWKKQEGDMVNEGDVILEMMSDKTSMELEAEDSGILLKIVHGNGATVPVTEVIAYLGAEGEVIEEGANVAQATADLKAAGLEVPTAPAAAPQAPKAELAADEYDMVVVGGGHIAGHRFHGGRLGGLHRGQPASHQHTQSDTRHRTGQNFLHRSHKKSSFQMHRRTPVVA